MKKVIMLLSIVLLVLSGCGQKAKEELEKRTVNFVAMGDSLTEGIGDEDNKGGYVNRFTEKMTKEMNGIKDIKITNTALKGRRSDELIEQLKSGAIDKDLEKANFISLTMGGNDLMKIVRENITSLHKSAFDEERPKFMQRFAEVLSLIRERNATAPIVVFGLYNPVSVFTEDKSEVNTILTEWNSALKQLVEDDNHAVFVPVEDLFESNKEKVYSDDFFHPNAKGYTNMSNRLMETLHKMSLKQLTSKTLEFKDGK